MTKEQLHIVGNALWGFGWQSEMSRTLGVNERTVRRWASGDSTVPDGLMTELRPIIENKIKSLNNLLAGKILMIKYRMVNVGPQKHNGIIEVEPAQSTSKLESNIMKELRKKVSMKGLSIHPLHSNDYWVVYPGPSKANAGHLERIKDDLL